MCEAGKARSSLPRRRLQIITQASALLQSAGGLRGLLNGLYVMRRVSASCVLGLLCRSSRSGKARVGLVASSASYADHRGAGRRASASLRRLAIPGPIPLAGPSAGCSRRYSQFPVDLRYARALAGRLAPLIRGAETSIDIEDMAGYI